MKGLAWALLLVALTARVDAEPPGIAQLGSVLWTQQSLEFRAVASTVYRAATQALPAALDRPGWASLERGPASSGRSAVVLDLDETVLDNTPFFAGLIQRGGGYTEPAWQAWIALESAREIPGALAFTRRAESLGADVFYVSNRQCIAVETDLCPALTHTMANLARLGFPRALDPAAYLLMAQQPGWGSSDKTARRLHIAQTHRIGMLLGDDLRDFLPAATIERWRAGQALGEELFGERWFILPNPMYGSWEKALPNSTAERVGALQVP